MHTFCMFPSKAKAERGRMYVLTKMLSEWNRGCVLTKDESSPQEMTLVTFSGHGLHKEGRGQGSRTTDLRGEREGQRRKGKERRGKRKRKRRKEKEEEKKRKGRKGEKRREEKKKEEKEKEKEEKERKKRGKKRKRKRRKKKGKEERKKEERNNSASPAGGDALPEGARCSACAARSPSVAPAAEGPYAHAAAAPAGAGRARAP